MSRVPLAETLIALAEGVQPPRGAGLIVTEAEIEMPLEVQWTSRGDGPVFFAAPPHTRWKSGIAPRVHMGRMRFVLLDEEEPEAENAR